MSNEISGKVVRGNGFGRKIGFPTANVELAKNSQRPADGIYACWVKIHPDSEPGSESRYMGALHVGPRPAIGDVVPTIEVHILDFAGRDLYGQQLSLQLVKRLRDVKNFDSMDELKAAIQKDCEEVRRYFAAS
jgi:riboflavin kinase/FMN adenylyltransferase